MRSFIYYVAFLFDLTPCTEDEGEKVQWEDLIALLTPVVKSYGSDKGFFLCNQAMLVLGGAG